MNGSMKEIIKNLKVKTTFKTFVLHFSYFHQGVLFGT